MYMYVHVWSLRLELIGLRLLGRGNRRGAAADDEAESSHQRVEGIAVDAALDGLLGDDDPGEDSLFGSSVTKADTASLFD